MIVYQKNVGAGVDSSRPYVRVPFELTVMLRKGSNKLRSLAFDLDEDEPQALRTIQAHSIVEAEPRLTEWRKIFASDAPRLYHGTRYVPQLDHDA